MSCPQPTPWPGGKTWRLCSGRGLTTPSLLQHTAALPLPVLEKEFQLQKRDTLQHACTHKHTHTCKRVPALTHTALPGRTGLRRKRPWPGHRLGHGRLQHAASCTYLHERLETDRVHGKQLSDSGHTEISTERPRDLYRVTDEGFAQLKNIPKSPSSCRQMEAFSSA